MEIVELLLIFNLFFLFFSTIAHAETIEVRNALVQFMEELSPGNISSEPNWGWNASSDPCNDNWRGVSCNDNSPTIKRIVLDNFNLTGQFNSTTVCVSTSLLVLSLNSNNLVGTVSDDISKCRGLTHIYLNGNKFSGNLPVSLSRLSNLKRLVVSDNTFSGSIPDLSRISGLLTFLAENNQLIGSIPNFDFSNLQDFNVSDNNLSGPIPDVGGHFNVTSFLGNQGLCGEPLLNPCSPPPPPPPAKKTNSSHKDNLMYSGYALIGFIVVSLIALKLFKKAKSKKRSAARKSFKTDNSHDKVSSSTSSESRAVSGKRSEFSITSAESGKTSSSLVVLSSPVVRQLKFEDLLRSPAELMGRGRHGSLYKVTINEGLILVVKRIRDWEISRDDFQKRMQRIDQVKHPSVMPAVAFYCSKQEKLLVYEFQQKGSLFRLLDGSEDGQSFDWGSRLNVASKISEALAFMHESLQVDGIAHGNLKSSNIILSTEMEPRLSEYGLVEVGNHNQSSFLDQDDSLQENSLPSNYNRQKKSFKADTYGFGVILLELLTGKPVQSNGFDLARWVNSAIREEWTVEVFDKVLVSDGADEEQMVNLLQVALKCINSSSEARPSMREVAGIINSIKESEEKSISSDHIYDITI